MSKSIRIFNPAGVKRISPRKAAQFIARGWAIWHELDHSIKLLSCAKTETRAVITAKHEAKLKREIEGVGYDRIRRTLSIRELQKLPMVGPNLQSFAAGYGERKQPIARFLRRGAKPVITRFAQ